jgi:hypothetical protein
MSTIQDIVFAYNALCEYGQHDDPCDAGRWKDTGEGVYFIEIDEKKCSCGLNDKLSYLKSLTTKKQEKPFGYFCDWGDDSYGLQRIAMYYGSPGSASEDDWNEFPKVCVNLPLYLHPTETDKPTEHDEAKIG